MTKAQGGTILGVKDSEIECKWDWAREAVASQDVASSPRVVQFSDCLPSCKERVQSSQEAELGEGVMQVVVGVGDTSLPYWGVELEGIKPGMAWLGVDTHLMTPISRLTMATGLLGFWSLSISNMVTWHFTLWLHHLLMEILVPIVVLGQGLPVYGSPLLKILLLLKCKDPILQIIVP